MKKYTGLIIIVAIALAVLGYIVLKAKGVLGSGAKFKAGDYIQLKDGSGPVWQVTTVEKTKEVIDGGTKYTGVYYLVEMPSSIATTALWPIETTDAGYQKVSYSSGEDSNGIIIGGMKYSSEVRSGVTHVLVKDIVGTQGTTWIPVAVLSQYLYPTGDWVSTFDTTTKPPAGGGGGSGGGGGGGSYWYSVTFADGHTEDISVPYDPVGHKTLFDVLGNRSYISFVYLGFH